MCVANNVRNNGVMSLWRNGSIGVFNGANNNGVFRNGVMCGENVLWR